MQLASRKFSPAWFFALATGAMLLAAAGSAAADKLTEANMTQRDYDRITNTENSEANNPAAGPKVEFEPIHDLTRAEEAQMKEQGHATKVIRGKDWEQKSPVDRDAHLRRLRETAPEGSRFLIEVPNGDVWLVPPLDAETMDFLKMYVFRRWAPHEKEALPVAVGPGTGSSHSDRSGTMVTRGVTRDENP